MSVDTDYFTKKLNLVIRDIHQYTAEELSLELYRLASTANQTVQSARINELGRELAAEREAREKAEADRIAGADANTLLRRQLAEYKQRAESAEARIEKLERPLSEARKVTEGWKLVPVNPSRGMMRAAKEADMNHDTFNEWMFSEGDDLMHMYAAMLSASPEYKEPKP